MNSEYQTTCTQSRPYVLPGLTCVQTVSKRLKIDGADKQKVIVVESVEYLGFRLEVDVF